MKKITAALVLTIVYSRFLPIPFVPESWHQFFYDHGLLLQVIAAGLAITLAFFLLAQKRYFLFGTLFLLPLFPFVFINSLIDVGNTMTVWYIGDEGEIEPVILGSIVNPDTEEHSLLFPTGIYAYSKLRRGPGIGKPYFDNMKGEIDWTMKDYYGDNWLWMVSD